MDHSPRPDAPASSSPLAELHAQCRADYALGQAQRAAARPPAAYTPFPPAAELSEMDVAIRTAQQLLDSGQLLAVREGLRLLLRALGGEPSSQEDTQSSATRADLRTPNTDVERGTQVVGTPDAAEAAVARSVAAQFPVIAAFLAADEKGSGLVRTLGGNQPDDVDDKGYAPVPTPGHDHAPAEPPAPVGPGCGAPATARIEGYSPRNGLDLAVYACADHTEQARSEWLGGLLPHTWPIAVAARCGHSFDYTTLTGRA
ncbi:hypothetical protein ABZX40_17870 [Streptomyces sp. NPDC004610]|uniref:hypothetical protein n=1 Tax=unclassified Streptomyces TaxID=2593676 RepID=UPI0033A291C7